MYRLVSLYPYYNGCIPITVYMVQKLEEGWLCDKWVNVKGYEDKKKAEQLLKLLKGRI